MNRRLHIGFQRRGAPASWINGHRVARIGMVSARIAEMVLRDERTAIPIGSYHPRYGVTLSLPTVLGRAGVLNVIEPELSAGERQALQLSADRLQAAIAKITV